MSTPSYWLTYDARHISPQRRRWPWLLLLLIILVVGVILILGLLFTPVNRRFDNPIVAVPAPTGPALYAPPTLEPTQVPTPTPEPTLVPTPTVERAHSGEPVPIQEALPVLLIDAATIIYVIDDSKSMSVNLQSLHDALLELASVDAEYSEVAIIEFGGRNSVVFGFTDPSQAPWDSATSAFDAAEVGGTNTYTALRAALGLMPEQPTCFDHPAHEQPVCRERRIVLLSDGGAKDPHVAAESLQALVEANIPVDSIALGTNADHQGLRDISQVTGGNFVAAY